MTSQPARWMTDELILFGDQVRRFVEREFAPHRERWDREGTVDQQTWRKAGEAGILCASIPASYGGGDGTRAHDLVILDELNRAGLSDVGAGNLVQSIVAHYVMACGTEHQKQRWLPRMATGDLIAAIAMTEPGTGSDLQSVITTARRDGSDYVINGQKTFISNGQAGNLIIVVAKTDPKAAAKGISLIGVETETVTGFRRGRNLEKIGM